MQPAGKATSGIASVTGSAVNPSAPWSFAACPATIEPAPLMGALWRPCIS